MELHADWPSSSKSQETSVPKFTRTTSFIRPVPHRSTGPLPCPWLTELTLKHRLPSCGNSRRFIAEVGVWQRCVHAWLCVYILGARQLRGAVGISQGVCSEAITAGSRSSFTWGWILPIYEGSNDWGLVMFLKYWKNNSGLLFMKLDYC
jgi:hypothetical protein